MPRKFERAAVLVMLMAAPFCLSALPQEMTGAARMSLAGALEPVLAAFQSVRRGARDLGAGLFRGIALQEENRSLRTRLEALLAHEVTHRELFSENARLRELIAFRARSPWKLVPAEVIGRELGPWSRTLLIDRGTADGVERGMAVITPVGLVGRVSEAGTSVSRVVLITDSHFRVTGMLSERRVSGLVRGAGSGRCVVTYLPPDLEPAEGELVITAGGKSFCPGGVLVGTAGQAEDSGPVLYRTLVLEPAVDLAALKEVLVIRWPHVRSDSG